MQKCVSCSLDGKEMENGRELYCLNSINSRYKNLPYVYRINDFAGAGPNVLQQVCKDRGWKEFGEKENLTLSDDRPNSHKNGPQQWNFWWRSAAFNSSRIKSLRSDQITNHIPKASFFCRKDSLARYLRRLRSTYGTIYDFSPLSFNLPLEYTRLVAEHTRRLEKLEIGKPPDGNSIPFGSNYHIQKGKKVPIWISKPIGKSQGRGIIIFDQVTKFSYHEPCVVQEYVARPFLISGHKWDLRLYVCVTCTNPLTLYAYQEGITRFATSKYDLQNLYNYYSHLTNTYINKQSPAYNKNKEVIGFGSKWTLAKLRGYFYKRHINDYYMWQRIWSILVLTVIGDIRNLYKLESRTNCFEFLGFDILVDENLKPHLLEVNTNPGLNCDQCSLVDEKVKKPMLHDLFNLLGLPDTQDLKAQRPTSRTNFKNRLLKTKHEGFAKASQSSQDEKLGTHSGIGMSSHSVKTSKFNIAGPKVKSLLPCRSFTTPGSWAKDYVMHEALRPRCVNPCEDLFQNDHPGCSRLHYMNVKRRKKDYGCLDSNSMNSYGNWVKVFPFNKITTDLSRKQPIFDDDLRECIMQVMDVLRYAKDISRNNSLTPEDSEYDSAIKSTKGVLEIWHPALDLES